MADTNDAFSCPRRYPDVCIDNGQDGPRRCGLRRICDARKGVLERRGTTPEQIDEDLGQLVNGSWQLCRRWNDQWQFGSNPRNRRP